MKKQKRRDDSRLALFIYGKYPLLLWILEPSARLSSSAKFICPLTIPQTVFQSAWKKAMRKFMMMDERFIGSFRFLFLFPLSGWKSEAM